MKLEFSTLNIQEVIATIEENKLLEWQADIIEFLKQYQQENAKISIKELQGEVIFDAEMQKENILKIVRDLNRIMDLKQGDSTLLSQSIKRKAGVIAMAQAIEAKMDIYCTELTENIKIPFTGQDQNTIHWGLNYVYLTDIQIQQSSDILHRIEKIAVETYGLKEETNAILLQKENQMIYEIFSVKSLPVAIRKLNDKSFETFGDVSINRNENGHLIVSSPNFLEPIDTQKAVFIENENQFRWISAHEYFDADSNHIIDFDHIEEVLKPQIPSRFVVINYPDAETGKDVVTLVVKRLYIDDFNFSTEGLKDYEIPRQNYSIGDFPETDDRSVVRDEVKRLLAQQ